MRPPTGTPTPPTIGEIRPAADETLAASLLAVQHAAYAVEAALIGDDRIPPLHETLSDLRAAPLGWLGAHTEGRLVGALAWTEDDAVLDIDRLIVDPAAHRRGVGRALVRAVLDRAGARRVVVATGRANQPARRLYESLGFAATADQEVLTGLWITRYARLPSAAAGSLPAAAGPSPISPSAHGGPPSPVTG